MSRVTVGAVLLLAASCGPVPPPVSVEHLEAATTGEGAALSERADREAWSEARRYLALAKEAARDGDAVLADRLAVLGTIQARLAEVAAKEEVARRSVEEARARSVNAKAEVERLETAIDALEHTLERERLREHLVAVVDETRRRAAAREELEEAERGGADALARARGEVGREILARGRLELALARAMEAAGVLEKERLAPLEGALALAGERLAADDPAGVQEFTEEAAVEARRVRFDLWPDGGAAASASLSEALVARGLTPVVEASAVAISLPAGAKARSDVALGAIEAVSAIMPRVGVVVVCAGVGDERAAERLEATIRQRAPSAVVSTFLAGPSRPSMALAAREESAALLFVPLPEGR